jgi:long-subunit acyl-CoA synthetase (AMP-forming)
MKLGTLVASLPAKRGAVYCLERGKQVRLSFAELHDDVVRALANLRQWGVKPGTRVGLYAPNSCHWVVYDLALVELGAVSVPFTADFAGKIDRDLIDKYHVSLLLVARASVPMPAKAPWVAVMDGENENVAAIPRSVLDEDAGLLTLAFSSGSAGGLKGLAISRDGVEATLPPIYDAVGMRHDDRLLLFMPLSNFQQRTMCYAAIWYDFDLIITDYVQLLAAIKALQPTLMIAPPMYFHMIHARFTNLPPLNRALSTFLAGLVGLLPGESLRRWVAAGLFTDFYQQFGGRMRVLLTGMAPVKQDVAKYFSLMQLPLCESYGLVETGSLTYREESSKKYGSVGKPVRGVTLEIAQDGEVIVNREKSMTVRYFQSAEGENERTFLGAGRIATGDIGRLDSEGYLYLLGRKRELIITPGGYKLHPEIVERELAECPDIAQAAVFLKPGSAMVTCVASLHQPGEEARSRARAFIKAMKSTKQAQIGDIIFVDEQFSVENGLLRPNLKIDRRAIVAKFSN